MENIKRQDLQALAEERIEDARALFNAGRYSGAVYICGYAIEMGLKRKICETLGWDEYEGDGKCQLPTAQGSRLVTDCFQPSHTAD